MQAARSTPPHTPTPRSTAPASTTTLLSRSTRSAPTQAYARSHSRRLSRARRPSSSAPASTSPTLPPEQPEPVGRSESRPKTDDSESSLARDRDGGADAAAVAPALPGTACDGAARHGRSRSRHTTRTQPRPLLPLGPLLSAARVCPTGAAAVTRDDDDDDTCPVANADGGSGADRENDDDDDAARDVEEEPRRPASAVIGDSDSRDAEVLDANDAATECGAASESRDAFVHVRQRLQRHVTG